MQSTNSNRLHQINEPTPEAWDAFVGASPAAHILQTSGWGTLKNQFGWQAERIALGTLPAAENPEIGATGTIQDTIQAAALTLFRTIGWRGVGITLGYVPCGPLVNWQNRGETNALLAAIEQSCRRRGAALLKIEPDLPDTAENRALLTSYGFLPSKQSIQPRSTTLIDISGDDEAILASMKQKWRYNVRLSQKKGITIRTASPADLPAFNRLMETTGQRDGFAVHSAAYYNAAYRLFVPDQAAYLLAEFEGEPIAAIVVTCVGKTGIYLWGASADKERNRMPNHALQWAGIRWAKAQGATLYDFWGIPDEIGILAQNLRAGDGSGTPIEEIDLDLESLPGEGLWGVYRFKQGFNGTVLRTVGAWDKAVSTPGYVAYRSGLWAREKLQQTRQKWNVAKSSKAEAQKDSAAMAEISAACQPVNDAATWRSTLAQLPNPHVLQSWEWGQIKSQTEWHAERFVLKNEAGAPNAAFQLLWRQPIPFLPLRVGYVPKGPVVDWGNPQTVDTVLSWIQIEARRRHCIFVKIDPDVREDSQAGRHLLARLKATGWRFSDDQIQFKNSGFSDLSIGEDGLLDGMKQKWRYNVRLAEKRGIRIRQGGVQDLQTFYELYAETGKRDGFLIRPFDYYRATWQSFLAAQQEAGNPAGGALLLAEHDDESAPVAGIFLFRYGQRSWYFYGASSERHRRDMPNYLLQWESMRWSQKQGCTVYDWWGAPTEIDNPEDSMQGVWQFKQGFGAEFQPHIGAWDFPVWGLLYDGYTRLIPLVLNWMRSRGAK